MCFEWIKGRGWGRDVLYRKQGLIIVEEKGIEKLLLSSAEDIINIILIVHKEVKQESTRTYFTLSLVSSRLVTLHQIKVATIIIHP